MSQRKIIEILQHRLRCHGLNDSIPPILNDAVIAVPIIEAEIINSAVKATPIDLQTSTSDDIELEFSDEESGEED